MQADNRFQPAYGQITFRVDIHIATKAKEGVLNRKLKIISVMQLVCLHLHEAKVSSYYSLLLSRIFLAFPALCRALLPNLFYDIWLFLVLKKQEQPNLATISEQTFLFKVLQEASVSPPISWSFPSVHYLQFLHTPTLP